MFQVPTLTMIERGETVPHCSQIAILASRRFPSDRAASSDPRPSLLLTTGLTACETSTPLREPRLAFPSTTALWPCARRPTTTTVASARSWLDGVPLLHAPFEAELGAPSFWRDQQNQGYSRGSPRLAANHENRWPAEAPAQNFGPQNRISTRVVTRALLAGVEAENEVSDDGAGLRRDRDETVIGPRDVAEGRPPPAASVREPREPDEVRGGRSKQRCWLETAQFYRGVEAGYA